MSRIGPRHQEFGEEWLDLTGFNRFFAKKLKTEKLGTKSDRLLPIPVQIGQFFLLCRKPITVAIVI